MNKGEILIYQNQSGDIKVDVRFEDETVWLNQAQMGLLFGKSKKTISEHISNIFKEQELQKKVVVRNFRTTATDGKIYNIAYYNLDVIISVGYRVKSLQGTQFRIWATKRLRDFITKGFLLDDERFSSGSSMNYFNELQDRIRKIRLSEKFFYQKIKDIYTTSIDYNPKSEKTIQFFKVVQNKLLWAISKQTAAELVYNRVDASAPLLGMLSYDKDTLAGVKKSEVSIAKNYLNEKEMELLGLIVEQYLAFAQTMAAQHNPMYMDDWIKRLDVILQMNGRELLDNAGSISHKLALDKAGEEFDKFKKKQKLIEKEASFKELENDLKELAKRKSNE